MDTYITKAKRLIEEATAGLTEEELSLSPDDRWSPAQVLEHLAKAFGTGAKAFELQLQAGELQPIRKLTMKDRVGIFVVCTLGYMPEGRQAPSMTIPSDHPEGMVTLRRALENLERTGRAIDEAEKKWGANVHVFTHPILGPLTATQWRKFHFVHTRHHMKQIVARAAANRSKARSTSA